MCVNLLHAHKSLDKLNKKLDNHIREIWSVYEPIKKILEKFDDRDDTPV